MAKNIQILKRSTVEMPNISSYKLVLEAVNAQNMPDKIFVNQRIQDYSKNTVNNFFAAVCTPVQLEDFPEDNPEEGSSYYRTNVAEIVVRTPEMLQAAFDSILYEVKKLVLDLDALDDLSEQTVYNITGNTQLTGITNLTPVQVAAFSTVAVTELSTAQISEMTTAQIAALNTTHIVAMDGEQIAAMTPTQIKALSTTQVVAIEAQDIPSLTVDQVAALSTNQTKVLSTTQLQAMEPVDVASLPAGSITQFTTTQLKSLSVAQLGALTLPQVGEINAVQRNALSNDQISALKVIPQFPSQPVAPGFWIPETSVAGNVARIVDLDNFANNLTRANIGNAASWSIAPYSVTVGNNTTIDNSGFKFSVNKISQALSRAILTVVYKNDASNPSRPGKDAEGYQYPYVYVASLTGSITGNISIKLNNQQVFAASTGNMPTDTFTYYPFEVQNFGDNGKIAPNQVTAFVVEIEATGSAANVSGEIFMAYD